MKRICVAGIIQSGGKHSLHILMGRRGKDPNRGLYVLPGGGVKDDESLEDALCREILEETGLEIERDEKRWDCPKMIFELEDRIILLTSAGIKLPAGSYDDDPKDGDDLYDVKWFSMRDLPWDVSPVCVPMLYSQGFKPGKKPNE